MYGDETVFVLRNILLVQLVLAAAVPESTLRLHRALLKLWQGLKAPVRLQKKQVKKNRFWEIDMTKFEP